MYFFSHTPFSLIQLRGWLPAINSALALLLVVQTGCGRVEWNWDVGWWQKPRRVVKPVRRPAEPEKQESAATPEAPAPPNAQGERPPVKTPEESAPESSDSGEFRRSADRSYLQLYLVSTESQPGTARGESQYRLHAVSARTCATALEMLCVPIGRSGSADECYLLYEDRGEFNAARELAAMLDVPLLSTPPHTIGPEEALSAGIGLMFRVIEQGAIVDEKLVGACVSRLTEALQSNGLDAPKRWAAGILAGRLTADFKYDYALARNYYQQSERFFAAGSRENATAKLWQADAFSQEGRAGDADAMLERVQTEYISKVPTSALVERVRSGRKKK